MPSDEYASAGGGALRIKGAKVKKHKKKKARSDLEKNLSTGEPSSSTSSSKKDPAAEQDAGEDAPQQQQGDEELEKARRDGDDGGPSSKSRKTEAERRFEEVRRKKLLELAESAGSRPELLKTHKERVEELNTYLSKLSEHHDMPKIGPG